MSEQTKGIVKGKTISEEGLKGKTYFLGIGINKYDNFSQLNNTKKDIEDILSVLTKDYQFEKDNVVTLFDMDATRRKIISHLNSYCEMVTSNDRLLIYFAGHSWVSPNKQGYWIPVDALSSEVGDYINNVEIREIISRISSKHTLLISDSCFSESIITRGDTMLNEPILSLESKNSRYMFVSGSDVVSDGEKGKNSPFAKGILDYLSENKEDAINIVLLSDRVIKKVRYNHKQMAECAPIFQTGHDGGQFIFYKNKKNVQTLQSPKKVNTKDFTKYKFGEFDKYGKSKLVRAVIREFVNRNPQITFEELKKEFPMDLNKQYGTFKRLGDVELNEKIRFYMEPAYQIQLKDEIIVVCNQWGAKGGKGFKDNFTPFLNKCEEKGLEVHATI